GNYGKSSRHQSSNAAVAASSTLIRVERRSARATHRLRGSRAGRPRAELLLAETSTSTTTIHRTVEGPPTYFPNSVRVPRHLIRRTTVLPQQGCTAAPGERPVSA